MADIYQLHNIIGQNHLPYQFYYNQLPFYQTAQPNLYNFLNPVNINLSVPVSNQYEFTPKIDTKAVIDLQNTQTHSSCQLSQSLEKHPQNIFAASASKEKNENFEQELSLKLCQEKSTDEEKLLENSFENPTSIDIFSSPILNKKCQVCFTGLLNSQMSSSWVQCSQCLEMKHAFCQIFNGHQSKNQPICMKCNKNVANLKIISTPRTSKKIRKIPKKQNSFKPKVFRGRTESFVYLDSFLNSFGYRMSISEQQIRKEVKTLERKLAKENSNLTF